MRPAEQKVGGPVVGRRVGGRQGRDAKGRFGKSVGGFDAPPSGGEKVPAPPPSQGDESVAGAGPSLGDLYSKFHSLAQEGEAVSAGGPTREDWEEYRSVPQPKTREGAAGDADWAGSGFSEGEARWYQQAGVRTPEEAQEWKDAGFDRWDTKTMMAMGVRDAATASALKDAAGGEIGDVEGFIQAGVTDPAGMKRWAGRGLNPESVYDFEEEGFTPEEYSEWIDAGIFDEQADGPYYTEPLHYRRVGVRNLEDAKRWKAAGFSPDDVFTLGREGIKTVDEARRRRAGSDTI